MPRRKKIEDEIIDSETKAKQIQEEVDINEIDKEAETIKDITFVVWDKEYKVSELIKLIDKPNKTYFEIELAKKFKLIMQNYYNGIMHAVLRTCCGKRYTIEDLKKKLTEEDIYNIIDIRCSRNNIRFDKDTVDTVVYFAEKYLKV